MTQTNDLYNSQNLDQNTERKDKRPTLVDYVKENNEYINHKINKRALTPASGKCPDGTRFHPKLGCIDKDSIDLLRKGQNMIARNTDGMKENARKALKDALTIYAENRKKGKKL